MWYYKYNHKSIKNIRKYGGCKRPVDLHKAAPVHQTLTICFIHPLKCTSNLFLKLSTVPALTTCLLSLFHSFTTILVNQFLPISFLNLNLSSLKPFVHVLTFSLTMRTLFMSPLLKPLTHLNTFVLDLPLPYVFLKSVDWSVLIYPCKLTSLSPESLKSSFFVLLLVYLHPFYSTRPELHSII